MEIKPTDRTVKDLLGGAFYKIPRFQRPYSWDRANVEDFWNDAIITDDPDYFIGSFVFYKEKGDQLFIVDGQQRLTTITLLLATLRDAFDEIGSHNLAKGAQILIEREDIDNKLQFVLQSETPYPYLQEQIQKHGHKDEPGDLGTEQQSLKSAHVYLSEQVAQTLASIDADPTLSEKKKKEAKKQTLTVIRDNILRLQLISVVLGNEDDAYLIFETLNTRGKDLTVSDLVKNHLTRLLRPRTKGVDRAKDKWNEIPVLFDSSEIKININRFLHHSWLSRNPYTTEKKLFKEVKKTVHKSNANSFLDTLILDAHLYSEILDVNAYSWDKQERELADSIRALNLFRVVQPVPLMLSLLREYQSGNVTLATTKRVFRAMENFHVQFTAITNQRTGGGTAFMYSSSARLLLSAQSRDKKVRVLREFVTKLRDRVPSYEEFEAAFIELEFTDENTRYRGLVRYLLRRIDEHLRSGVAPDYDQMTIEHLAPQTVTTSWKVSEDHVGVMGNLLLVSEDLNEQLGTKTFKSKKELLLGEDSKLYGFLKNETRWNNDRVKARTLELAQLCHDKMFQV